MAPIGADDPTRTGNRLITIQLLCQLSYVGQNNLRIAEYRTPC